MKYKYIPETVLYMWGGLHSFIYNAHVNTFSDKVKLDISKFGKLNQIFKNKSLQVNRIFKKISKSNINKLRFELGSTQAEAVRLKFY